MSKTFWRVAVIGFVVINVGGMIYAVANGDVMHGLTHLAVLGGGVIVWKFFRGSGGAQPEPSVPATEKVLDSLQESIDAIALNVERIGEDQRFQAKLVKDQLTQSSEADGR